MNKLVYTRILVFIFLLGTSVAWTQQLNPIRNDQWAQQILDSMSLDEKLGQLFMIRAHSDLGQEHIDEVKRQIKKYHVGGLCFFQGTPEKQAKLTNEYQQLSKTPLLIAVDAEWGLGMRFKKTAISFPRQLTLGAIQDNRLIYEMGKEVAEQCRRIGIHVNFAPVVDVNNNPENPVINNRSFGEDRYNVSAKSYHYMQGMQENKLMACAKHFPGHGDTDVDSHLDLPVINHSRQRLDSIELYPFRIMADKGIQSMMIAHLQVPAIDSRENTPTTLSYNAIGKILRNEMQFDGLIYTDALEMEGVAKHYETGEVEYKALMAGNDVLVLPKNMDKAMNYLKKKIQDGSLTEERVNQSVRRILKSKYQLELDNYYPVKMENIDKDINNKEALALKSKLIENAITLVRTTGNLLPIKEVKERKFASLAFGTSKKTAFQTRLDSYAKVKHIQSPKKVSPEKSAAILNDLRGHDVVFVSFHDMSKYASKNFGIDPSSIELLKMISAQRKVVVSIFGSPYSLKYFDQEEVVLVAYEEDNMTQDLTAQAIFGVNPISGRLPVSASDRSRFGDGTSTQAVLRLGYSIPERVGMSSDSLARIAKMAKEIIKKNAAPGCQILVVKDRKIVYNEAFGYHTYSKKKPVNTDMMYDLASITKVAATTLSVMKMQEQGSLDVGANIGTYFPESIGSNKENLNIKDVMAHHASLIGWVPFYKETITANKRNPLPMWKYYRKTADEIFSVPVVSSLFMTKDYESKIWEQLFNTDLRSNNNYRYSDLGFIMLKQIIKNQSQLNLDEYADTHFYAPMGLRNMTFNPWKRGSIADIPPTENDNYFRRKKIQGYVHDMGAAMMGGVSGHAGLFSNAEDLAVLFQMLLNGGYYGGYSYLNNYTISEFTKRHPRSTRRGIGFDLKELNPDRKLNMAKEASDNTFGHIGFTGTCVWADPDENLIFIFLSNRTYPTMRRNILNRDEYRPRIHSIVYGAIKKENMNFVN